MVNSKSRARIENRLEAGKYANATDLRRAFHFLYRRELNDASTPAENIVEKYLTSRRVRFLKNKGFLKPMHVILDFYLPKPYKLAIEVDGGYHLTQRDKDARRDAIMWSAHGIRTVRITNEQVFSGEFSRILSKHLQQRCASMVSRQSEPSLAARPVLGPSGRQGGLKRHYRV